MVTIDAYKMNGLGNNFIIIDRRFKSTDFSKQNIIELGKRENIDFDQIIFIEKEINNISSISIFNSDGNEVSACGNGTRCVAYLLGKEKNVKNISIKTNERILESEIIGEKSVKINMGKPAFNWNKIPLSKNLDTNNINLTIKDEKFTEGFAVNVGNPHVIFFVKDCFAINLKEFGPIIENDSIFPEKCNVTLAEVKDKNNIFVNVWERGAGLTKACGTAACATAVASFSKNLTNNKVNIKFAEGIINIEFDDKQNIYKTGPVSKIEKIKLDI
ncbi:diaminopimelate epimerase [Pelagibacteraceae bacterium]|nr:diaminopimelate epimerase [Pelagibacteraceae bacterium]